MVPTHVEGNGPKTVDSGPASLTRRRRLGCWVKGLVAVMIVAIVGLGVAEGTLRALGYGHSTRFLIEKQIEGRLFNTSNKLFYQQFFSEPVNEMLTWDWLELQVPVEKPRNAYRVFVFGGSAASGMPPDMAYSFGRILEVMLRMRFPDTRFEFYNTACPGMNSYGVRRIAKACAKVQPDVFIVYMGNNEITGNFGATAGALRCLFSNRHVIRALIAAKGLRVVQLAGGALRSLHGPTESRPEDSENEVATVDPQTAAVARVYDHFKANMEEMCHAGTAPGATVILCTVGSNLKDWPPLCSMHRDDLTGPDRVQWQQYFQAGLAHEKAGRYLQALSPYEDAAAIDDTFADLQFHKGLCHHNARLYEKAHAHFVRARELDCFPVRSTSAINEIIRDLAARLSEQGVYLADAVRYLEERSEGGTPGWDLFYDCVHPKFPGNYAIARAVFDQLLTALPGSVRSQAFASIEAPSQADCETRLALTPWLLRNHMACIEDGILSGLRPVFPRDWSIVDALSRDYQEALDRQAQGAGHETQAAVYRRALELGGADYVLQSRYVETLLNLGAVDQALEAAQRLMSDFPYRRKSYKCLGAALARAGKLDEAVGILRNAVAIWPDDPEACSLLANVLRDAGRHQEASRVVEAYH